MLADINKFKQELLNEGYENIILGISNGKEIKIILKDVLSLQSDENILFVLKNGSVYFISGNSLSYIVLNGKKESQ